MRKIRVRVLIVSGLIYRAHVIAVETVIFRLLTGQWRLAVTASLLSNLVTLALYYNYHYWFARLVKIGRNHHDRLADGK